MHADENALTGHALMSDSSRHAFVSQRHRMKTCNLIPRVAYSHIGVLIIFIVNINVYILGLLIIPKFNTFECTKKVLVLSFFAISIK